MILAKVLGTVVASEKHPAFLGHKLLVVQPVDENRAEVGESFIAADANAQAGVGDCVLVLREGNGVRQILGNATAPIRSLIVGVVDAVNES